TWDVAVRRPLCRARAIPRNRVGASADGGGFVASRGRPETGIAWHPRGTLPSAVRRPLCRARPIPRNRVGASAAGSGARRIARAAGDWHSLAPTWDVAVHCAVLARFRGIVSAPRQLAAALVASRGRPET